MLLISKRRTRKNVKEAKMWWDVGDKWFKTENLCRLQTSRLFADCSDAYLTNPEMLQQICICPKFVPYSPSLPLFSSWRSLLTFLCLGNFHFHSHTWNIQICLLLASKAGQMQQLFENKILQFLKVRAADYGLFRISSWQYTKCPSLSSSTIYTYSTGKILL